MTMSERDQASRRPGEIGEIGEIGAEARANRP
jgi:hypothetical protein